MSSIIGITNIKESPLWSSIDDSTDTSISSLKANLIQICGEASQRMKLAIKYFPQYTLHDEDHLLRMLGLVPSIGADPIRNLNSLEKAILILGIYFHDIGMVPSETEYHALTSNADFIVFKERWITNHSNYGEMQKQLQSGEMSASATEQCRKLLCELDQAILTEYMRERHAYTSGEYVRNLYRNDKRLEVFGINIADIIAKVCISHGMPISELTPENGYNYDEQIGRITVNLSYISLLIRLADILDFDRERTPDTLHQSIHFTSSISIGEWEKHRAVQGWTLEKSLLRYTMYFQHPVYENIGRKFIDLIDSELLSCHIACSNYPERYSCYKIELPQRVDRSRIGPKDNSYLYFDLEFSLSRNEIVNLLMKHNLYNSPSLCVRELLQNSADALRMRTAQFKETGIKWNDGKISFEHYLTGDGIEVLRCQDNGIGMDEDIIRNYFTKVGRSYYKSPDFFQRRLAFKKANADFDPCSQFGIGFMSCFMLGDRIVVETRKDYGTGKEYGAPLVVEINGTGGIISIRKGKQTQPIGTTVIIYGRKKPDFFDVWTDRIRLTTVLRGYALAIEFPINAKCSIPEIEEECTIAPGIVPFPSLLQSKQLERFKIYNFDLSSYGEHVQGVALESFLIDKHSNICISSEEGEWAPVSKDPNRKRFSFNKRNGSSFEGRRGKDVTVCLDGVLVAGSPGRPGYPNRVRYLLGWRNSGIYAHASCCVDIRGSIKPEITPARIPVKKNLHDMTPKWNRIKDIIGAVEGDIWSQVADELAKQQAKSDVFWKLAPIYSIDLS